MVDIHELLKRIAERCRANLSRNEPAKSYLRTNGINDESACTQFRIGVGDDALQSELSEAEKTVLESIGLRTVRGKCALSSSGLLVPTYDPREPEKPLGLVKQNYAQNKHGFVTAARGIALSSNLADCGRVVIADAPFLALRLAQAGVGGVVLAEVPDVLPALSDWLGSREIVLASFKSAGCAALKSALGSLGARTACATVHGELHKSSHDALSLLGIENKGVPEKPAPVLTQLMVVELVRYAQARLASGEGVELLREYGADCREFIDAYGLGYVPADYYSALPREFKKALAGRVCANSVLIPALDERGNACDVLALGPLNTRRAPSNLHEKSCGLIAPKIASVYPEIVITDSFTQAARMFKDGKRNVLFLRGVDDARANVERLRASGVVSASVQARRDADAIALALRAGGISVTLGKLPKSITTAQATVQPEAVQAPVSVPAGVLELIQHDLKSDHAIFKAGEGRYTVEITLDSDSRLEVRLELGGKVHLDRFDLAVEAQRKRFAASGAIKTGVSVETIDSQLVALLDEVRKLRGSLVSPATKPKSSGTMNDNERGEAFALLQRADLLDCVAGDLESLGWVGEANSKRLLYLTAISRKLPMPLSAALLSSSGAGKSMSIETIAELTPPEDLLHVSRLTDSALYYHDGDALRHKLLVVDEADALTPEVLVSLRVLQTRGALTQSHVMRDPVSGNSTTHFVETRGPVAVLTSTAGELDEQNLSRCFEVPIDESSEQTARVLDSQRRLRADAEYQGAGGRLSKIVRKHQNMQRLLSCCGVVIPFADRIQFPASSIKHRREQERFLNLIEASALLHQFQRLKHKNSAGVEFIVASIRDYEIAVALAADSIGRAVDELSQNARDVLHGVQSERLEAFDSNDLHGLHPEWSRHKVRAGIDELLSLDVLTTGKRTRPQKYSLIAAAAALLSAPVVRLLPASAFGDLATFGETAFTNSKPVRAIG